MAVDNVKINLRLESSTYFDKSLSLSQIQKDLKMAPDSFKALEHRSKNSLRYSINGEQKPYMYWKSDTWKIADTSLGTALHFTLLKQLMLMMTFISCISIVPIAINFQGGYYTTNERQSKLDKLSIGNSYIVKKTPNETLDSSRAKRFFKYLWVSDFCYSLLFLVFVLLFFYSSQREINKSYKKHTKFSEFAIEVKNIPRQHLDKEELKLHFINNMNLNVKGLYLGKKYGKILPLIVERQKIERKINICKAFLDFSDSKEKDVKTIKRREKKLNNLEKKIEKYDNQINQLKNQRMKKKNIIKNSQSESFNDFDIDRVFVVFHTVEDKNKCLDAYSKKLCGDLLRVQRRNRKKYNQGGKNYAIEVRPTYEPNDIFWENLNYGRKEKCFRWFISYSSTISIFLLTFMVIYYVKTAQSRLPTNKRCKDYDTKVKGDSKSDNQRLCYCKGLDGDEVLENTDDCSIYVQYLSEAFNYKVFGAIGIIIINFILKTVIRKFTKYEKTHMKSEINQRLFIKIFILTFINTSILTYLVNLKVSNNTDSIFQGEFDDFNREWFLSVGNYILITMLVSIVSPHLIYFMVMYPYGIFKRWYKLKNLPTTQYELNKVFTGPKFDLPGRTAQVTSVLFTCFLYSGGIPLLNLVCLMFLVIIYHIDKWMIYYHYKKPSSSNDLMYFTVIKTLPFVVFLHCSFSLYTYGSSSIFDPESSNNELFHKSFNENLANRLERSSGIANLILIILSLCMFFVMNCLDCCCIKSVFKRIYEKRNQFIKNVEQSNFDKVKDDENYKEILKDSFNIKDNPKYTEVINTLEKLYMTRIQNQTPTSNQTQIFINRDKNTDDTFLIENSNLNKIN